MAFFADTDLLLSCLIILPYNLYADKEVLLQLQQCICSLLPFSPSVLRKDSAASLPGYRDPSRSHRFRYSSSFLCNNSPEILSYLL